MQISTKMVFECVCGWVCFAEWYGLTLLVSICLGACCSPKKEPKVSIHYVDNINIQPNIQPKK